MNEAVNTSKHCRNHPNPWINKSEYYDRHDNELYAAMQSDTELSSNTPFGLTCHSVALPFVQS
jgi:hypothetical protein